MSLYIVRHSLVLAVKEFFGQSLDVWGRGMHLHVKANQTVAAAFLTVEVGARLPVKLLRERGGGGAVPAEEVIHGSDRNRQACRLGGLFDEVPARDGEGFTQAPGDELGAAGQRRALRLAGGDAEADLASGPSIAAVPTPTRQTAAGED